jgi:signal transduction histidine kinase
VTEIGIVVPVGGMLLAGILYVRMRMVDEDLSTRRWARGFVCLYASGVLTTLGPTSLPALALATLLNGAFVGLALQGALTFVGRPVPRWVLPLPLGIGAVRAVLTLTGNAASGHLLPIPLDTFYFGWMAWILWRESDEGGGRLSGRLLSPAYAFVALVNILDQMARWRGEERIPTLVAWAAASFILLVLHVLAIYERMRERDRRRTAELDSERRTLRAVLNTAPVDIYLLDDKNRLTMTNRRDQSALGIEIGADLRPTRVYEHLDRTGHWIEETDRLQEILDRIRSDPNAVVEDEEVTIHEGDVTRTYQLFSSPVLSESGERIGRVWITRDLTRERRLQQQLQAAQRMETLGTLAGGVAHDFNNQLTSILGNVELAMTDAREEDEALHEFLRDIARAAEHGAELTRALLSFARRAPTERKPLEVMPLVQGVQGLLRSMIPSSVSLEVQLEDELWRVLADPTQLEQVLVNLTINARDAVNGSGRVRIGARNRHFVRDESGAVRRADDAGGAAPPEARPGRFVEFEVRDDGTGLDRETRERMFDPFFTTKQVGQGTGLGLSIVYGLVSSHEGWLEVESQPGTGTTIRAYLPATDGEPVDPGGTSRPPASQLPSGPKGRETVLVADDDDLVRRLARGALQRLGYSVIEACDGEEAVRIFRSHTPGVDLVVLDLTMPGRSGLNALETMRRAQPGLPAIIASGYRGSQEHAEQLDSAERVTLLDKPFTPEKLGQCVRRVLDQNA